MKKDIKDMLEEIREENKWPKNDLLIVIHTTQDKRLELENALRSIGIKDSDGIEITTQEVHNGQQE